MNNKQQTTKPSAPADKSAQRLATAFRETWCFLDCLLANAPAEATDLLTNHGEEVIEAAKAALAQFEKGAR